MDELDKKYYKISEVSEMLGIPQSTLRYWETQFTILKPKRTGKGTRTYSPNDIEKIKMVKYLVHDRGMKLDKAQEQIRHNHSNITKRYEAVKRLEHMRTELLKLLAALDSVRR